MSSNFQGSVQTAPVIPDKLFFKIGEVCDLVGVQAHVLRYWESEFPMLQPQKNRAGQRTYRRKDVEMVLRIRELLYDEKFTIAGARQKLANEGRGSSQARLKVVPPNTTMSEAVAAPVTEPDLSAGRGSAASQAVRPQSRDTLFRLRLMLEDLLTDLRRDE